MQRSIAILLAILAAGTATGSVLFGGQPTVDFAIYGPARNTTGGLGKAAYTVTNLADTNTSGTLRYGLETFAPANGGAYITRQAGLCGEIVFAGNRIIATDNVTLDLGPQPGEDCPGVVITNSGLVVQASNVIVRHVRIRNSSLQPERDNFAITGPGPYSDIVFDHVSGSGAEDGTLDINALGGTIRRVTVQHSLLGRPSNDAGRCGNGIDDDGDTFTDYPADTGCADARDDDESTAGGQWGTKLSLVSDSTGGGCVTDVAFYRNVLMGGTDRNISFTSRCTTDDARIVFAENVTYDNVYGFRTGALTSGADVRADFVRNSFKRGPSRVGEDVQTLEKLPIEVRSDNLGRVYVWGSGNRLVDNGASGFDWADDPDYGSSLTGAETDVFHVTSLGPNSIPLSDCTTEPCSQRLTQPVGPYRHYLLPPADPATAAAEVLAEAGASPDCRDPLDQQYLDEVSDGTRAGPYPSTQPTLADLAAVSCAGAGASYPALTTAWGSEHPDCPAGPLPSCGLSGGNVPDDTNLSNCSHTGSMTFNGDATLTCVNWELNSTDTRGAYCNGVCRVDVEKSTMTGSESTVQYQASTFWNLSSSFGSGAGHTVRIERSIIKGNRVGVILGGGKFDKDVAAVEPGYAFVLRESILREPIYYTGPNNDHSELIALVETLDGVLIESNRLYCRDGLTCNTGNMLGQPANGGTLVNVSILGNAIDSDSTGIALTFDEDKSSPGNCITGVRFEDNVIDLEGTASTWLITGCPAIPDRPNSTCTGNTVDGVPGGCS